MDIAKAMVACHKPDSLKYLLLPIRVNFSEEEKLKSSAYVVKKKESTSDVDAKYSIDKIVEEEGVTENMLSRLNSILSLVGKEVGQNSYKNIFFIKWKKNC